MGIVQFFRKREDRVITMMDKLDLAFGKNEPDGRVRILHKRIKDLEYANGVLETDIKFLKKQLLHLQLYLGTNSERPGDDLDVRLMKKVEAFDYEKDMKAL